MARKGLVAPDDSTIKEVEARGVNVVRLTDGDKQAFRKATQGVYDKWAKTVGPELVKKAEQSIAKRK
jgi:TRAP-type C4-dicarboxylate transport system substrate-binding protein